MVSATKRGRWARGAVFFSESTFLELGLGLLGLGYHGQSLLGFGRLWAQSTRGFGLPWAKFARFWATTSKVHLGLGGYGYGHKHSRVWATIHGQKPLGFGLPWAKFTWVWAIMGTNHPRVWATIRFWATMGKLYLGLGDYGHKRRGFGLPRPK